MYSYVIFAILGYRYGQFERSASIICLSYAEPIYACFYAYAGVYVCRCYEVILIAYIGACTELFLHSYICIKARIHMGITMQETDVGDGGTSKIKHNAHAPSPILKFPHRSLSLIIVCKASQPQ